MAILALIVFLGIYGCVATGAAWGLYKIHHGYEEEPDLEGSDLWRHCIWGGIVATAIAAGSLLLCRTLLGLVGPQSEPVAHWGLLFIEGMAWGLFCVWFCETNSIFEGMVYGVFWGLLKAAVQLLIFLPFGFNYWLMEA